ncbi:hypothetical protein FD755_024745 [Muntiacus reevesi]|uniref:Uncharacterized protein n=1 Tax=Muntiacus reevesi TaxID=9886 RepID=A0A5N3UVD5_MUNRE|nr:hypothetical protein FD755_024745 [Muntiacus reevesi]
MGITCIYALMFTLQREKAEELQGKVLCRGNFLIWQNLPEQAEDWLEITSFWLFFIVLMYVTVKLAGESARGGSFGPPRKKNKTASPDKESMLDTLTLLKMDLVKFVSSVWNMKLDMAASGNFDPLNAPNNTAVYEL